MAGNKQVNLNITGMTCAACSSRIEKVLNKMDDVDASVNLTTEKATVEYDSENVDISDITGKIEKLGYGVEMEKAEFDITGMTCAACSNRIEKVLNKQEGVKSATVNLTTENAVIEYNPNMLTDRDLIARVEKLGYGAKPKQSAEDRVNAKDKQLNRLKVKLIISALLSLPLLVTMLDHLFGIQMPAILMSPWFQLALATPVQFIIGWQFYDGAYKNLR
ncbi:heavy metal translocating P-type ATPase, partial [Salinicoccus roseus]